jgi:uncharacterized membrane protein YbhN (UPF0104 family)
MASAEPLLLTLSVVFGFLIILADGAFWAYSMRSVGLKMPFRTASLFSFVGWFFSNIAPSTVGADLFRAAQMRYAGATTARAVRLVVAARLMALAALLLVIGAGAPFVLQYFPATFDRLVLGALYAAVFVGFAAFLFLAPVLRRRPFSVGPLRSDLLADLSSDLATLIRKVDLAGWVYLSAQHLLRVASVWAIARSVGADVSLIALFALVPLALLVAMAPVSFAGWGVREASFVGFLGLAGTDAATALAISILYGLSRAIIGAMGGVAWLLTRADHYAFAVEPAKDER